MLSITNAEYFDLLCHMGVVQEYSATFGHRVQTSLKIIVAYGMQSELFVDGLRKPNGRPLNNKDKVERVGSRLRQMGFERSFPTAPYTLKPHPGVDIDRCYYQCLVIPRLAPRYDPMPSRYQTFEQVCASERALTDTATLFAGAFAIGLGNGYDNPHSPLYGQFPDPVDYAREWDLT